MNFKEWLESDEGHRARHEDAETLALIAWNAARLDLLEQMEADGLIPGPCIEIGGG